MHVQESESRFHKAFASGFGITAGASLAVLLVTFLLTQFLIPKLSVVDGNTDAAVQIAWILTGGLAFSPRSLRHLWPCSAFNNGSLLGILYSVGIEA